MGEEHPRLALAAKAHHKKDVAVSQPVLLLNWAIEALWSRLVYLPCCSDADGVVHVL